MEKAETYNRGRGKSSQEAQHMIMILPISHCSERFLFKHGDSLNVWPVYTKGLFLDRIHSIHETFSRNTVVSS